MNNYNSSLQILSDGSPQYTIAKGESKDIGLLIKVNDVAYDVSSASIPIKITISKYETSETPEIDSADCVKSSETTGLVSYNVTPTTTESLDRGVYYFVIKVSITAVNVKKFKGSIIIV